MDSDNAYTGRFAPSPTGELHLGSLVAAVGSYLDARHQGGRWLVRIEDLDTPRVIPGCAERILHTLEQFGLHWDGEIVYQSRRTELYRAAAQELERRGLTFECSCSRRELSSDGDETGYPGTCRAGPTRSGPTATRFRVPDQTLIFEDRVQGHCSYPLGALGDFVIRRKDGLFSYQLAVVVDDAEQQITDVIRGVDLLQSTIWQRVLQEALALRTPRYAHLPLVVEPRHGKLAKSRASLPVDPAKAASQLAAALRLLNHPVPVELESERPGQLLEWARDRWDLDAFHSLRSVTSYP